MVDASLKDWIAQVGAVRVQSLFHEGPRRAAPWVRALALDGMAPAQVCYGRMLLEGNEVSKSETDALRWFKRAALQGDLDAINMVGRCLENGWGCDIDMSLAAVRYHEAADRGHDWAQYNLGHLYLDGLGVDRDVEKAYRYYMNAASQGHARAMNLVGRCCEEGWGAPQDRLAAADWYRRSAEAGYFRGQYNWASVLLSCGLGADAAVWFERAALCGTPAVRQAVLQAAASAACSDPMAAMARRLNVGSAAPCS